MKVIVLGAGHGTRLERDLVDNEKYQHLIGTPKLLLPIAQSPLMSHWMRIFKSQDIDHIYIGTNDRFKEKINDWVEEGGFTSRVSVISDGTDSNLNRLGATSCIGFVRNHFGLDREPAVVMAGDLLFTKEFKMEEVLKKFEKIQKTYGEDSSLVITYTCSDQDVGRHGILEIDEDSRVVEIKEKPAPESTKSRSACPCFYLLSNAALQEVSVFLEDTKDLLLEEKDAPGNFIRHLVARKPVFAHQVKGRFDVGNLESYLRCDRYFTSMLQHP